MQDLTCAKCRTRFDRFKYQPRLFPFCGHTFCTECISRLIVGQTAVCCPEDLRPQPSFDPARGIECFPLNVALMNLLSKTPASASKDEPKVISRETTRSHFCKHHHKLADLICLTDKKIICSKCALFGDHRNHEIKEIEDFKQIVRSRVSELSNELEKLRKPVSKLQVIESAEAATVRLDTKKRELFKIVEEGCLLVRQELIKKETLAKEQIDAVFNLLSQAVANTASGAKVLLQRREVLTKKWERANMLLNNQELDFDFFLDAFFGERECISASVRLLPELEAYETSARNELEILLQNVSVNVNTDEIRQDLTTIFTVVNRNVALRPKNDQLETTMERHLESRNCLPEPHPSLILSDQIKPSLNDFAQNDTSPVREVGEGAAAKTPTKKMTESGVGKIAFPAQQQQQQPSVVPKTKQTIQSFSSDEQSKQSQKSFDAEPSDGSNPAGDDHSDIWPTEHRPDDSSIQDIKEDNGNDENKAEDEASISKIIGDEMRIGAEDQNSQLSQDGDASNSQSQGLDASNSKDFIQAGIDDPILKGIETSKKNSSFLKPNQRIPHKRYPSSIDMQDGQGQMPHMSSEQFSGDYGDPSPVSMANANKRFSGRPTNFNNFQSAVRTSYSNIGSEFRGRTISGANFNSSLEGNFNPEAVYEDQWSKSRMLKRNTQVASSVLLPQNMSVQNSNYSQMFGTFGFPGVQPPIAHHSRFDGQQYGITENPGQEEYEYVDNRGDFGQGDRMARGDTLGGQNAPKVPKMDDEFEINLSSKNVNMARLPELMKAVNKNKKAKVLNLAYNFINEKGVELVLDKLANHPSIETIIFNGNTIEESVFDMLTKKGKTISKKIRTIMMKDVKTFKSLANIKKQINVLKRLNLKVEI